jgi:hypothetical protein
MIPLLDALAPIVNKLLDFIPDPAKKLEAQQRAAELIAQQQTAILSAVSTVDAAQNAVNVEEAKSTNWWIAAARPSALWVCVAAMAWTYVAQPVVVFVLAACHKSIALPVIDFSVMQTVLFGLLGLGTMRTVEKIQGVHNEH